MASTTFRRLLIVACCIAPLSAFMPCDAASAETPYPFFAFQNGLRGVPFERQADLLKELGYDGIEFNGPLQQIPEMLNALDASGLKMYSIYTGVNLAPDQPPYDPELKTVIEHLNGRGTILSLYVRGAAPSASDAEDRAVAICREIAEQAERSGLRIALYPHVGFYIARVEEGVRLAKKVDRKHVGVGFNLCHFLKLDDEKNLERRLREASPYLFAVSINGADRGETNTMTWDRLIRPLDRGDFDVGRVLKLLKQLDYRGPVGLQCYNIPGDCRENLARSIGAWRKLSEGLATE